MKKLLFFLLLSSVGFAQTAQVQHGGTGHNTVADNQVLIATGTNVYSLVTLPACPDTGTNHLNYASHSVTCGTASGTRGISFTIGDPAGSTLSSGSTTTDYVTVPFGCTINAWNLAIDAGTITVKFWKIATGTAIPTSSNSINTSGVAISSGTAIHSTTTSDFTTTTISANDILAMNVSTVSGAHYVNGVLACQ